jgi:nicotinamide-nucleotide amidase
MSERVEIITIGDEVLRGEVSEDNAMYLAASLASVGMEPSRISILPDDVAVIAAEFSAAAKRSRIIIVTGGLGPTIDDVTKDAAVEAFGLETEVRDGIIEQIASRFRALQREMPDAYRDQATVPKGAGVIPNAVGAAFGLRIAIGESRLFLLPGVPSEMKEMFEGHVLPEIAVSGGASAMRLRSFGLSETEIEDRLKSIIGPDLMGDVSLISSPSGVDVYLPGGCPGDTAVSIERALGTTLYASGDEGMAEVVLAFLAAKGKTLAVAESVTGGLVAHLLVSIPGASRHFLEGFVTYSNEAKVVRLGVDSRAIRRHGAVSEEVCVAMALGAAYRAGADCAIATTGIAGPQGGSAEKPVGLCFAGLAAAGECYCRRLMLAGGRGLIRCRTAYEALDLLRLRLLGDAARLEPYRRKV